MSSAQKEGKDLGAYSFSFGKQQLEYENWDWSLVSRSEKLSCNWKIFTQNLVSQAPNGTYQTSQAYTYNLFLKV